MKLSTPETISNPRDFLHTSVPQLTDLDSLLRCHICKDFLKASVLTPCGHSFCSICIRKYLQKESKCPLCLSDLTESMLQKEFLVQEICSSYVKLRDSLQRHLTISSHEEGKDNEIIIPDEADRYVGTKTGTPDNSSLSSVSTKKRKHDGITTLLMKKKADHTQRQEKKAQCPICSKHLPLSELESSHIDECLNKSSSLERSDSFEILDERTPSPSTESSHQALEEKTNLPSPNFLKVEEKKNITYHNERYLNSGLMQQKENRLPRLDFQSLSITQLKQKLAALALPSNGTKHQMVARYKHYEMLWNSNFLDSIDPVDETELKRRLSSWEAKHNTDHSSDSNSITNLLRGNKRTNTISAMIKLFKSDRFDRKGWMRHHTSAFKALKLEAQHSDKLAKMKKEELSQKSDENSEVSSEPILKIDQTSENN